MEEPSCVNIKRNDFEQSNEVENLFPQCGNVDSFTRSGFKILIEATKSSNKLPYGKTRDLYESYPIFHTLMRTQANGVLSVLSRLMKFTSCKGNIERRDDEDKFEMVVDANDAILEKVGIALDEISGIRKNQEPDLVKQRLISPSGSWNKNFRLSCDDGPQVLNVILNKTKNLEKPQLHFKDKINNEPDVPFEPKIKYKYNMLKPLSLVEEMSEDGISQFTHPYEFELHKFKPSAEQLACHPPKLFKPLDETPLHLITTVHDVTLMIKDLKNYKEISVDLEHHSYRSFQGFTCLMQISTRDSDYIIDTLVLRSELECLNEVFTDPLIVKVFHGAELDIVWLQKDLGLYVVNMFDTYQAVKLLNFPKLSLAYLLRYYCNVDAKKHFQLADWRIRPLPEELITYAREDTHYLLFVYDNLKNSLIQKANGETNLVESVISESTRICLKRYLKPTFEKNGYLDIYHKSKKLFDNRQKFALQSLYEWRDRIARESDESPAYVLPDHMMLNISEILPREAQGILACCNPIPVPVRQNLLVLHEMILKARAQPLSKPVLEEERFQRSSAIFNCLGDPLRCPHDLNHEGEFRDDLPVLLHGGTRADSDVSCISTDTYSNSKPIINVFRDSMKRANTLSVEKKTAHLSPYHRYKMAKKFSESEEAKSIIKCKEEDFRGENERGKVVNGRKCESSLEDTDTSREKETAQKTGKKRKANVEESVRGTKKVKNESDGKESQTTAISRKKKKKRQKIISEKDGKQFEPFDYHTVNFEKYQSGTFTESKKIAKKFKRKKKNGKKKFKISV